MRGILVANARYIGRKREVYWSQTHRIYLIFFSSYLPFRKALIQQIKK